MTILKRGNSKYWYVQFQIGGRTVIRSSRTINRKAAEQLETSLRSQVHAEKYLGQKRSITFADALARFVQSRAGTANHRNLLGQQRTILQILRGSKRIDDLSSEDVDDFRRHRADSGASAQTIKHGIDLIRCAWKLAKRQGYRVSDLNFPSVKISKGRMRYLTVEEERKLLFEIDPQRERLGLPPVAMRSDERKRMAQDAYDLVVLLLDTGARYGEIANLEWRQIDLDKRLIRLWRPKVRNESVLFMTGRVYAILDARSRGPTTKYVFMNKRGGARGYAAVSIRKALNRAGLTDCTIHTLRHTHATRLIQNGLSVYEVQAVLGHTDIKTTMRYAHLEQATVTARARDVIDRLNAPMVAR